MNKSQWLDAWLKIKDRFPNWQPTKTEAEDWCLALRVYTPDLVDQVGRWVAQNYTSKVPALKWFIKECEQRKRAERVAKMPTNKDDTEQQRKEYEERKKYVIEKLEQTSIEDLRSATIEVLSKFGHIIARPENGKPREWKQTLRGLVFQNLYGDQDEPTK